MALTLLLGEFPFFSPSFGLMRVGVPLAVVLLYVALSRWLADPSEEGLAARLPSVPRVLLRLAGPWVLFLGALALFFSLSPQPVFQG
ncbi:hypothetical protein [Archangium sp.]|uniref:hypothetical protein n=1 Tax=Archangium sp. TaxID=1872627 RepID=UPI00389AAFDD